MIGIWQIGYRPRGYDWVMRWVRLILVLLLIGAVINVAVAWGCAWRMDPNSGVLARGVLNSPKGTWYVGRLSRVGATRYSSQWRSDFKREDEFIPNDGQSPRSIAPEWIDLESSDSIPTGQANLKVRFVETFGLPLNSLWCERRQTSIVVSSLVNRPAKPVSETAVCAWNLPRERVSFMFAKALPLGVRWPEFVINTMVYAIVCGMVIVPVEAAWRNRRRRQRRCLHCGYDLCAATSATCPECGKQNKTITTAATGSVSA